MLTTTIVSAHVRNGQIVLDEPTELPEGLEVQVVVPKEASSSDDSGSILDDLRPFIGAIDHLPPDASTSYRKKVYGDPHNDQVSDR